VFKFFPHHSGSARFFLLLHQGLIVGLHIAWPQVCISQAGYFGFHV